MTVTDSIAPWIRKIFFGQQQKDTYHEPLRKAYNGVFKEPNGVKFTITITANKTDSFEIFKPSLHPAIVRMLTNILWILEEIFVTEKERQYQITSSDLWFGE